MITESKKRCNKRWRDKNKEYIRSYNLNYNAENKETRSVKNREYHDNNLQKYRELCKEYYREHKEDYIKRWKKRKQEFPWESHYYCARYRCNEPGATSYKYYGGRDIKFELTMGEIKTLYLRDNARDMDMPSIDRMDNDGNYIFDNCRFIERSENTRRANKRRFGWK